MVNAVLKATISLLADSLALLGLREQSEQADVYSLALEAAEMGITATQETQAHAGGGPELIGPRLEGLGYADYDVYTASARWVKLREQYSKYLPKRCNVCGAEEYVHLHHRSYLHLGCEAFTDLEWLCEECHYVVHTMVKVWPEKDKGPILWAASDFLRRYMRGAVPSGGAVAAPAAAPFDVERVRSLLAEPSRNEALEDITPSVYFEYLTGRKAEAVEGKEYVEGICPRGGHYLRLYPEASRGWYCPTCKGADRLGGGKIYHLARHMWGEPFSADGFLSLKQRIAKTMLDNWEAQKVT